MPSAGRSPCLPESVIGVSSMESPGLSLVPAETCDAGFGSARNGLRTGIRRQPDGFVAMWCSGDGSRMLRLA
jgi:hypothetical protein